MELVEFERLLKEGRLPFNIVIDNPSCPAISKIHPFKQKAVDEIYKLSFQYSDIIKTVRVFGSSVTHSCCPWSDLDICIEWLCNVRDEIGRSIPKAAEYKNSIVDIVMSSCFSPECDILNYDDGSRVMRDVVEKGVIIYE